MIDTCKFGDIVCTETKPAAPSKPELEEMAKRRFQAPRLEPHGGWWTIRIRRDVFKSGKLERTQVREKVALLTVKKREALKLAALKLEELNQQPITLGAAMSFTEFADTMYTPVILASFPKSSRDRYQGIIDNHLKPKLGQHMLFELERQSSTILDVFFVGLPKDLCRESLRKIRTCLSSMFNYAIKKNCMVHNPARNATIPQGRPTSKIKPTISVQQFNALVELIPEPYATMVYVAIYTGMRVSEVIALRWKDLVHRGIIIDEKCCRGDWNRPKTESSNATIGVLQKVLDRINALKGGTVTIKGGRGGYQTFKLIKSDSPDDLIFQGVRAGRAMRDNNVLTRFIKPAARKLGIGFVNWRCLRTSHATWLKRAGVPVKDASVQMRHAKPSTTLEIYQQTPDEDQLLALEKLEALTQASNTIQ